MASVSRNHGVEREAASADVSTGKISQVIRSLQFAVHSSKSDGSSVSISCQQRVRLPSIQLSRYSSPSGAQRQDRAAVRERLVHGRIEPVVAVLRLRAVERALPAGSRQAATRGALPGLVLRVVLIQQHVDTRIRCGLERLGPARGGATATARLLSPPLDDLQLLMDEVVARIAEILGVENSEVVEILPGGDELRLWAGVGWGV